LNTLAILLVFSFIFPLSRYHNLQNLERDKANVTKLVISLEAKSTVILLPRQFSGEHRYLAQVLALKVGKENIAWQTATRCTEGDAVWYKLIIPAKVQTVGLHFDHPWQDFDTTITLPVAQPESTP
jgi:hypothetical protein